jgi:hypothetical protein
MGCSRNPRDKLLLANPGNSSTQKSMFIVRGMITIGT